ncbi:DNA topoisomerase I [Halocalculus aciditolerans]|uniref:DNA topoisomerase 1 n=1 Tax=Halocalculus aciditolerans TaxID=1383812 RepID=A0A830FQI4_9EURY|nr:DNA topoisomerase I [Halocalculus aciditolerans]GGL70762.1 DNA topoisomerase I [Halocalculus aciditolerans]
MELIITEKNNAARRIADILSEGGARADQQAGVYVYEWGGKRCVGLSGHVVGVDFPSEYEDWRDVEPRELVDAPIVKTATQEDIVNVLQRLARDADDVVIATDYDREGELIGKEAYELVRDVNEDAPVKRVRFSSITENEVKTAFAEPDELDFELAAAGEARQIIDLVWGAALTRFLSLSARQMGEDFISVGRVQSPTLKLIVDKEREIEAFDPDDYWELFADLAKDATEFEAQYFYLDEDDNEAERVWDEDAADEAFAVLREAAEVVVESVRRRTRTDDPPAPFNTTQYIRAASSLGYGAGRAMSIAEDLYTAGYITYPRTDNTVYPDDLDPAELVGEFDGNPHFSDAVNLLRDLEELEPTAGDEETTDHPPIHPTPDIPARGDLSEDEWEVYELVVRRFFATLAEPAEWEHLRVVAEVAGENLSLKANGRRLLEEGYHAVYPYFGTDENYVPDVEEGEQLEVVDARIEEKQTQPPRRYGQSRLIETMESLGIGTKSTRHNTIEKLYDRGYIEGDPPRPTRLAMAVVEAAEQYADLVVSEEMTAELEEDMTAIVEGETTLDEVTEESREMLGRVFESLGESREEIGDHLRESLKADKTVGPCPECGNDLLIRRASRGSYFVGCDGYPDCEFTLPLPDSGEPIVLDETCEEHDLHEVKMLDGRSTFVHGCPLCAEEDAGVELVVGACPECGEDEGGELAVKRLRNGNRLVGCTRYPDCEYSLSFPRNGDVEATDEICEEHDLPELVIRDESGEDWEFGCPVCNYEEYRASRGLTELDGIGSKTAEKLNAVGVEDVGDLRDADADELADDVDGVSADSLRDWQAKAD